jgi:preprotein translocase subunit Sss1
MRGCHLGLGKIHAYAILLITILGVLIYFLPSIIAVTSTPQGNFTALPNHTYFNWTSETINVTANNDSVVVIVRNESTEIQPLYFTGASEYSYLNSTQHSLCFNATAGPKGMKFVVQNQSGEYTNMSGILNNTNSTLFSIAAYQFCPPGKYSGYFYISQNGSSTENLTLNATVNILINPLNTFNTTSNRATFKGSLTQNGNYHSYYFNTSLSDNLTSVTINLSGFSGDVDLFLFDSSGNLLEKSIEKSGSEEISYLLPTTPDIWELRIYGNITSAYNGNIHFSTINSSKTRLNFGELGPNQTSSNIVFNLENLDDQIVNNVDQYKEIYHVDKWSRNVSQTFYFLVPSFAEKVKVRVEWEHESGENLTNWTISLRDANGNLINTSIDKHLNANKTNAIREEFIIYNGPFNTDKDGFWNITVLNRTDDPLNSYNVSAYIWVSPSWINTNFSTSDFNSTGNPNSSYSILANVSIPETNLLNGSYEGFLQYNISSGWKLRIPLSFEVKAGMLTINNNLSSSTYRVTDNIGFNRISAPITLNITYNNTGGYPIYYSMNNSSNKLYLTTNSSYYIDFTIDNPLPNPIENNTNGTIDISLIINTSKTGNNEGIYRGWIFFNTTNTSVNSSSYPFKTFNLTLEVNLTSKLNVTIDSITPDIIHPPNESKNVTVKTIVRLINGTIISKTGIMGGGNFASFWMNETNVTTYGVTLTKVGAGDPEGYCPSGNNCYINVTIPPNKVGGRYNLYASVNWNTTSLGGTGEVNLSGTGVKDDFVINDTGLKLTVISPTDASFGDVNEASGPYYLNMTVKNYGPVTASNAKIIFNEGSCSSELTTTVYAYSCTGTTGANTTGAWVTSTRNPYDATGCYIMWKITLGNVSADKTCSGMSIAVNKKAFDNGVISAYLKILDVAADETQGGQQTTQCSSDADCPDTQHCVNNQCVNVSCTDGYVSGHTCHPYVRKLNITNYEEKVYVLQGSSNSSKITVKNEGNVSMETKLKVTMNIAGVSSGVSPSLQTIGLGESKNFTVNFSTSNTTEVGYYTVTLKAYFPTNESISDSKDITLAILPREETKKEINKTRTDYKNLFEELSKKFNEISPDIISEANYSKANRTYHTLKSLFDQIEEYINTSKYIDAKVLLNQVNETLKIFEEQINQLISESKITSQAQFGNLLTWIAVGIIVVVVIGFIIYLLLPPKEGYHPLLGFRPKRRNIISNLFLTMSSRLKKIAKIPRKKGAQKELVEFEKAEVKTEVKKPYMRGYERLEHYLKKKEGFKSRVRKRLKKK